MQVKMLIGPKAGQVVDLVYHAAKTLVEAGQAEDINDQMRLAKPKIMRIDDIQMEGTRIPTASIIPTDACKSFTGEHKKKRK